MAKRLALIASFALASFLVGSFLLRGFVHSGGLVSWLGFALAPGMYAGALIERGTSEALFWPVVSVVQILYWSFFVTLYYAMRK